VLPSGKSTIVTADEAYLHESILNSTDKIVKGYQPIMPSYRNQLTEEQVSQLVAYIRSLKDAKVGPAGDEVPQTQPLEPAGSGSTPAPGIQPGIGPGPNR
jgi:mono/diheme cytochrome c family protein